MAYGLIVVTIIVYFWNSDANSGVIIGHYILSAAFTIWTILGYLYSKGTWIDVIDDGEREDSRMIIRNPFEGERIFMMSEIGEVKLEKDTAMYIYDADGNGAGASVLFAVVENKANLTNADFTVI